jgi:hypothetical protein
MPSLVMRQFIVAAPPAGEFGAFDFQHPRRQPGQRKGPFIAISCGNARVTARRSAIMTEPSTESNGDAKRQVDSSDDGKDCHIFGLFYVMV